MTKMKTSEAQLYLHYSEPEIVRVCSSCPSKHFCVRNATFVFRICVQKQLKISDLMGDERHCK